MFGRKESKDKCKVCGKPLPNNGDPKCSKCGTLDTDRFHAKQGRPTTPVIPEPTPIEPIDESDMTLNDILAEAERRLNANMHNPPQNISERSEESDEERYDDDPIYCDVCGDEIPFESIMATKNENGEYVSKFTRDGDGVCEHCSVPHCGDCDELLDSEGYCKDCDRCEECSKVLNHDGNCPDGH